MENSMPRRLFLTIFGVLTLCLIALMASRLMIARAARGRTYSEVSQIPYRRVGMVLGCPKRLTGGWSNPFFEYRIAAAAELYQRQKVDYLVVSGDNHVQGYDEPSDMRDALVEKGVPAERIYLDYAGFRTLDSVVRLKEIFGQQRVTIVSQKFHNQRAIFLAAHHGIDAIGFNARDVPMRYALKTALREQFAKTKAVLDIYLFRTQPHFFGPKVVIANRKIVLDDKPAADLAEIMCRQLPNVGTILTTITYDSAVIGPVGPRDPADEIYDSFVIDDTYDALLQLGKYSMPCLVKHLSDTRWMPDPRSEPLVGSPVVGDVAYMILGDKGVKDVLPALMHRNNLYMWDYFNWPSAGDHRQRLQSSVLKWLSDHPTCCTREPLLKSAPTQPRFHMSAVEFDRLRAGIAGLHPGMTSSQVLSVLGKPDATDREDVADLESINLLGICAANRNEKLAYVYFVERWTNNIARRDPLHDRYVIVFFSAEDKLTRVFSNVAEVPPIFPQNYTSWMRTWGEESVKR